MVNQKLAISIYQLFDKKLNFFHDFCGRNKPLKASRQKFCFVCCSCLFVCLFACFSRWKKGHSLRTADVFPVVASLPPKNNVHGNRFAGRVRRRYFSEGAKRQPEIRLRSQATKVKEKRNKSNNSFRREKARIV